VLACLSSQVECTRSAECPPKRALAPCRLRQRALVARRRQLLNQNTTASA